MRWDPLVLAATGVESGGFLGSPSLGEAWVDEAIGTGKAAISVLSLLSPAALYGLQPGAFALGAIDFEVVGEGEASFELDSLLLVDAFGDPLALSEILVSAMVAPETSSIASALTAWIALAALRRRRSAR